MSWVDKATKVIALGTAVAWFVLAWLTVIKAVGLAAEPPPLQVGDTVLPWVPSVEAGVEDVGRVVLGMLYQVFRFAIMAVVIIAGIQAAIGLVQQFIVAFLPITVPRGGLNSLIRTVLGLLIIKAIVDAALSYFGYAPATVLSFRGTVMELATYAVAAVVTVKVMRS